MKNLRTHLYIIYKVFRYALIIPLCISLFLIIWYSSIQPIVLPSSSFDGFLDSIIYGLVRSVSHNNMNHLLSNIFTLSVYGMIIGFMQQNRIFITKIIILFLISGLFIGFYLESGVGFSIITNGFLGILIMNIIIFIRWYYKSYNIDKNILYFIISSTIVSILMLPNIVFDFLIVFDVIELEYLEVFSIYFGSPDNYSFNSSVAHISGFVSGIIIWTAFHLISYKKQINLYSIS